MKRITVIGSTMLMAAIAFADTTAPAPGTANKKQPGPCVQIAQACKAAGFVKGEAKEGKGLYKDCVQPIVKGQSVQGVTVDSSVVQACQQKQANRKKRG